MLFRSTEQDYKPDENNGSNILTENVLFQEYADIRAVGAMSVINGSQQGSLAFTHTAITRYLPQINNQMRCHRRIRNPDRSVSKQSFIVVGYEPWQQENRFMQLKLSEVEDNGH